MKVQSDDADSAKLLQEQSNEVVHTTSTKAMDIDPPQIIAHDVTKVETKKQSSAGMVSNIIQFSKNQIILFTHFFTFWI